MRRQVDDLAMKVALVTRDRRIKALARRHGFPVYPSLELAKQGAWHEPSPAAGRWGDLISVTLLLGFMLLLLGAGFFLVAPSAEVKLMPKIFPIETLIEVRADPEAEKIDWAARTIPARMVEASLEGSAQIPTVSQKDVPDERAKGRVVFTNRTGEAVKVPKGTVVATSAGTIIRFVTLEEVTVPPGIGARAEVEVEAMDAGLRGNVKAFLINTIEGPLALKLRVINTAPTSGGSVKRRGVVTQADKERLKALLLKRLHREALSRLEGELEEGEFVPPETIEVVVIDEIYDKFVDEVADSLGLKIRAIAKGMAINMRDVEALACSALGMKTKEGFRPVPESLQLRMEKATVEGESVLLTVRAKGIAAAEIDRDFVRGLVRGKSVEEARESLSGLPLEGSPLIRVDPPWLGRMPWLPLRIKVSKMTNESMTNDQWPMNQ